MFPLTQATRREEDSRNNGAKRIMVADDNANDLELTLSALAEKMW